VKTYVACTQSCCLQSPYLRSLATHLLNRMVTISFNIFSYSTKASQGNTNVLALGGRITFDDIGYDYPAHNPNDFINSKAVNSVERVGLSPGGDGCGSIPRLPVPLSSGTAAFIHDRLILCGGHNLDNLADECYVLLSGKDEWLLTTSLPFPTDGIASSIINGQWLLSGGWNRENNEESATHIYNNGVFIPGPEMPVSLSYHSQITLNSTHVIFVGAFSEAMFVLDWTRQEYTMLEAPPLDTTGYACGLHNNPLNGQGKQLLKSMLP